MHSDCRVWMFLVLTGVVSQGCANMSILQTAETLEPGAVRVQGGAGAYISRELDNARDRISWWSYAPQVWVPLLEVGMRYGVVESWDVGLRYSLGGHLALDVKHELFDRDDVTLSIGLAAGYSPPPFYDEDILLDDTWELAVPFYASVRLDELLTVYGATRLVMRAATTAKDDTDLVRRVFLGVTAGLRMGEQMGVLAEVTYGHGFNTFSTGQMNVGLFLDL
jgi:hypothetical protein